MRNLYYIYDNVSDMYLYFNEAPRDEIAMRAFVYACKNDFKATAPDLSLYSLGRIENDGTLVPDKKFVMRFQEDME